MVSVIRYGKLELDTCWGIPDLARTPEVVSNEISGKATFQKSQ